MPSPRASVEPTYMRAPGNHAQPAHPVGTRKRRGRSGGGLRRDGADHPRRGLLMGEHKIERGHFHAIAAALLGEVQGLVGLRQQRQHVEGRVLRDHSDFALSPRRLEEWSYAHDFGSAAYLISGKCLPTMT